MGSGAGAALGARSLAASPSRRGVAGSLASGVSGSGVVTALVRFVSLSAAERGRLLVHQPDQPDNPKVLRVAIIGAPNAGKSTLSNQLLGRKVKLCRRDPDGAAESGCRVVLLTFPK